MDEAGATGQATTGDQVFAEMLFTLLGAMRSVIDTVAGYKAQCLAAGFSPAAAEEMAVQLHEGLQAHVWKLFGRL